MRIQLARPVWGSIAGRRIGLERWKKVVLGLAWEQRRR